MSCLKLNLKKICYIRYQKNRSSNILPKNKIRYPWGNLYNIHVHYTESYSISPTVTTLISAVVIHTKIMATFAHGKPEGSVWNYTHYQNKQMPDSLILSSSTKLK